MKHTAGPWETARDAQFYVRSIRTVREVEGGGHLSIAQRIGPHIEQLQGWQGNHSDDR